MRLALLVGLWCWSALASAANVILTQPTQGQTVPDENVMVTVSVTEDFAIGKDGVVEIWVDGYRATTLTGKTGTVKLQPGSHQLQAHLVGPNHEALKIPANSEQVAIVVPQPDPRNP